MTPQEMVQDLFRVRQQLGRVPNRVEYQKWGKVSGPAIVQTFGSFALFVKCAGLDHIGGKRDKQEIRRQAHEKLIEEVSQRTIPQPPKITRKLLCISDLHQPYSHPDAFVFVTGARQVRVRIVEAHGVVVNLIPADQDCIKPVLSL